MLKKILFVLLIFSTIYVSAQRTNSSPYSFFGIGEQFSSRTVEQVSMGGIGVAYNNSKYLNFVNPAANAYLRYATYSFGILNNDLTIKDASGKQSSTSTSLNYFAFGTPIGKKAGFIVGMQPVSSVGYSLKKQILDNVGDAIDVTIFSGKGGVNRVYGAFGILLTKELSIGFEAGFSFGTVENSILNQRSEVTFATKHIKRAVVRGGSLKIGVQYKKELKKEMQLSLGGVLKLRSTLKSTGTESLYSLSVSPDGTEIPRDTISSGAITGEFSFPIKTSIGIGLGKTNKWYTGLEYEFQGAINTKGYLSTATTPFAYDNSNRISLGGFYLPKISSISSYWERVTYRAGIRFEETGLLVNGTSILGNFTKINDFGISFGLGLPLGSKLSNVNLGFEFGKKGTTNNNLIQENYFNFRLSLSLTDVWFMKRRID